MGKILPGVRPRRNPAVSVGHSALHPRKLPRPQFVPLEGGRRGVRPPHSTEEVGAFAASAGSIPDT